jgi:RHS repeat-associated protein
MEFDLPLGSYPGRGINVPVGLSYSSKLWRLEYLQSDPRGGNPNSCISKNRAVYGENSASGWTTSLAVPYIEYTGEDNLFDQNGFPINDVNCPINQQFPYYRGYIKRLTVHLPSGESHELRASDEPVLYPSGQQPPFDWNTTFYAVDGSNLKYVEDSASGLYRLLMPDGSFYDFSGTRLWENLTTIRKGNKFTDRNGNFTTYYPPNSTDSDGVLHPNGYWKDTLGRNISIPLKPAAPAAPTVQEYKMPGMTGKYKFHWKKLKGNTPEESGLGNFNQQLQYTSILFPSDWENWVVDWSDAPFNPIVLTAIELPTGQSYRFQYNIYGEIEHVFYPAGGEEHFTYAVVPPLGDTGSSYSNNAVHWKINRGVDNRMLYVAPGSSALQWTYSATIVGDHGYMVTTTMPDRTYTQRLLHRGYGRCTGCYPSLGTWGYDNILSGRAYEERSFSETGQLMTKKLTHWAKTSFPNSGNRTKDWHPRATQEESIIYDENANGVSATIRFQYEGDLGLRETPVLVKSSTQYAYVAKPGSNSLLPNDPPDPDPTPVPTPIPPTPLKTIESTFLVNDPNISQDVRNIYINQNMVGLTTVTTVRDGALAVVSRVETKYDEDGYSPLYRGNPTTSRVWDSGKGAETNANAYVVARAKFDPYGNQIATIDALGNTTLVEYDAVHHAFPVRVTTPAPDPNPAGNIDHLPHGSQTGFVTESTFDPVTGLPLTTKDANGLEIRTEYDPVTLRLKKVSNYYDGQLIKEVSESFYNDEPNNYWRKTRTQIDEKTYSEAITYYDGLGRAYKSEEIDSRGNIFVEKTFDAEGRVKQVTNPFRAGETRRWTTNVYDHASRIIEVILTDGSKVKTDYGVSVAGTVGVTKTITDSAGRKRKGISDALGRMIQVIEDPGGQNLVTNYDFDTLGNVRRTIQGEQSRYFSFDSLGRVVRAKQPEQEANPNLALPNPDAITGYNQWSIKYEYDDNGNTVSTTDARNIITRLVYDKLNRPTHKDYSDATPDVSFYYDGTGLESIPEFSRGKMTKVTSSVSETRYTGFDNLGRVRSSQQLTTARQRSGAEEPYTSTYDYNLAGAVVSETYPSGRVVNTQYNEDGKLESVSGLKPGQQAMSVYLDNVTYNSAGAVEGMRFGNGRWETAEYNVRLQVTKIGLGSSVNDRGLLQLDYNYGAVGQNNGALVEQKISYGGLPGQIVQSYTYDDLNRLKSSAEKFNGGTQSWRQTFSYDIYGNRRFDAANTTTFDQTLNWKITNPQINSSDNRLKRDQDGDNLTDYDYDKAGNLALSADGKRFIYNADNRQTSFFSPYNNSRTPDATYQYDGEGKRVRKVVSGSNETIFVYNASGQMVAEYSNVLPEKPRLSYLTFDHLGSPRIATDERGRVISRHDYMAFGEEIMAGTANRLSSHGYGQADDIRKQYTGYERDVESGLDYAQARYYNPAHGRFTSVDPLTASASIRNPQTFNRYSYALNSPYKFTDPLGLIVQTSCCTKAEIVAQIRKDFETIVMEDGRVFYPDEKSKKKIVAALYPYYEKAARLGSTTQQAINRAAEKTPRVEGNIETEVVTPGKHSVTTITGNMAADGGASAKASGKARSKQGTDKVDSEEDGEVSSEEHASTSGGAGFTTVITEQGPTTKTKSNTTPHPAIAKAEDKLDAALEDLPNIAQDAAKALGGLTVNGRILDTTNGNTIAPADAGLPDNEINPKANGFDLDTKIERMFEAGRNSRKPKQ